MNKYNSDKKSIIKQLQKVTTTPENFDWVKHYKSSFRFINPPKTADWENFKDTLQEIIPEKLKECVDRQKLLVEEQKKREKIIALIPEKDRYFYKDLSTGWFSEYIFINNWLRYWITLYKLSTNTYKPKVSENGITDRDIEKAKQYPIQDLYPNNLKQSGNKLVGVCPFHEERTGSFFIFLNQNSWWCFGCSEGGDSISFYMKLNNLNFKEAVKELIK